MRPDASKHRAGAGARTAVQIPILPRSRFK